MSAAILTRKQALGRRSPWTPTGRLRLGLWHLVWTIAARWTPKPANPWRLLLLRIFGARVHGTPFVHQRARIAVPWNVELHDRACIGDRTTLYSLDQIVLGSGCIVAQEAYLCCGTHDFEDPERPLLTAPITIEAEAFVGARAFVLPGLTIGAQAVAGAMSVVTRDVPAGVRVSGNPAMPTVSSRKRTETVPDQPARSS